MKRAIAVATLGLLAVVLVGCILTATVLVWMDHGWLALAVPAAPALGFAGGWAMDEVLT